MLNFTHSVCISYFIDIFRHLFQGNFREDNFQKSMAVIQEGPGSSQQKGRKGGTKGNNTMSILQKICCIKMFLEVCKDSS